MEVDYPKLYAYLGNSNVLPDYREYALVGAEQNDTDTSITDHDVYAQGDAKQDTFKSHYHNVYIHDPGHTHSYSAPDVRAGGGATVMSGVNTSKDDTTGSKKTGISVRNQADSSDGTAQGNSNRTANSGGNVTRGKRKAVFFYIKAM